MTPSQPASHPAGHMPVTLSHVVPGAQLSHTEPQAAPYVPSKHSDGKEHKRFNKQYVYIWLKSKVMVSKYNVVTKDMCVCYAFAPQMICNPLLSIELKNSACLASIFPPRKLMLIIDNYIQ